MRTGKTSSFRLRFHLWKLFGWELTFRLVNYIRGCHDTMCEAWYIYSARPGASETLLGVKLTAPAIEPAATASALVRPIVTNNDAISWRFTSYLENECYFEIQALDQGWRNILWTRPQTDHRFRRNSSVSPWEFWRAK